MYGVIPESGKRKEDDWNDGGYKVVYKGDVNTPKKKPNRV